MHGSVCGGCLREVVSIVGGLRRRGRVARQWPACPPMHLSHRERAVAPPRKKHTPHHHHSGSSGSYVGVHQRCASIRARSPDGDWSPFGLELLSALARKSACLFKPVIRTAGGSPPRSADTELPFCPPHPACPYACRSTVACLLRARTGCDAVVHVVLGFVGEE